MSRRRILLLTVAVVVLLAAAGGVCLWFALPRKTKVTIDVEGTPGMTIKGTCDVDGRSEDVTFTGSTKIVLEGYRVTYSLVSTEDSGQFRFWARSGERTYGQGGSLNPPKYGVRGWLKSSWWGAPPTSWSEVFNRDEPPPWLTPPPWADANPPRQGAAAPPPGRRSGLASAAAGAARGPWRRRRAHEVSV
jgi:hypothetical protein